MHAIHPATPHDAAAIATLQAACWPGERPDVARIARVVTGPDHATLIARIEDKPVGFVDGFLTLAADGARRWEVDLLAVDPAWRGRGVGRALIAACTAAGAAFAPLYARALIAVDNAASRRAFAAAGFVEQAAPCRLMIMTAGEDGGRAAPPEAHLVPVQTLSYQGVWVEGALTPGAFAAAGDVRARFGWDVAGAVIPLGQAEALAAAEAAGYRAVGAYTWWTRVY